MVHSLVYVSAASPTLTRAELRRLLDQSRSHNAAADITGLLLLRAGTFLQFIEGSREDVETLWGRIRVDERHQDVTLVRRRDQDERHFPTWSVAFGDVDPTSADPVEVEMPPPEGPKQQTDTEAAFILELLDVFDP
ncbi:BLUF domain-containing protein [Microlunatus flavus]|uniref:Sensors of blue-light using FAD n=1 Tax=Microlunatus flavus TaxID=1036181 RepID=A0A1H9D5A5_9ACTN|nr:BLUF domain-containing protein [Microlunatus flavus]SEQ08559.1 Sensors of blue-light using FAD [Microlunatus flavus]